MSFQTPDWDNDALGDSTCAELFQRNPTHKKKQKTKQKRDIIAGHVEKPSNKKLTKDIVQHVKHHQKNKAKFSAGSYDAHVNDESVKSPTNVFNIKVVDNFSDQKERDKPKKKRKKHKRDIHNEHSHEHENEKNDDKIEFSTDKNVNSNLRKEDNVKINKIKQKLNNFNKNMYLEEHNPNLSLDISDASHEGNNSKRKKNKKKMEHDTEVKNKNFNRNEDLMAIDYKINTSDRKLNKSQKKRIKDISNLRDEIKNQIVENSSKLPNIKTETNEIIQNKKSNINENKKINGSLSMSQKKKEKLKKKLKEILSSQDDSSIASANKKKLSLRERMLQKLKSARFRYLNEQMYSTEGKEAEKLFKSDPESYRAYHEGYRQQVKKWPLNPLSVIIKSIQKMPKSHLVADLGCGDALLSRSVSQTVYSFDLVAVNESVTACDMAHVPLDNESVDVVVFCLSLMGTNLQDYLLEANRILKVGGVMKIAEVESRFDNVENFLEGVQHFGFKNTMKDLSHNLFYFLDFKKVTNKKNKKKLPTISLNPCMYKKR